MEGTPRSISHRAEERTCRQVALCSASSARDSSDVPLQDVLTKRVRNEVSAARLLGASVGRGLTAGGRLDPREWKNWAAAIKVLSAGASGARGPPTAAPPDGPRGNAPRRLIKKLLRDGTSSPGHSDSDGGSPAPRPPVPYPDAVAASQTIATVLAGHLGAGSGGVYGASRRDLERAALVCAESVVLAAASRAPADGAGPAGALGLARGSCQALQALSRAASWGGRGEGVESVAQSLARHVAACLEAAGPAEGGGGWAYAPGAGTASRALEALARLGVYPGEGATDALLERSVPGTAGGALGEAPPPDPGELGHAARALAAAGRLRHAPPGGVARRALLATASSHIEGPGAARTALSASTVLWALASTGTLAPTSREEGAAGAGWAWEDFVAALSVAAEVATGPEWAGGTHSDLLSSARRASRVSWALVVAAGLAEGPRRDEVVAGVLARVFPGAVEAVNALVLEAEAGGGGSGGGGAAGPLPASAARGVLMGAALLGMAGFEGEVGAWLLPEAAGELCASVERETGRGKVSHTQAAVRAALDEEIGRLGLSGTLSAVLECRLGSGGATLHGHDLLSCLLVPDVAVLDPEAAGLEAGPGGGARAAGPAELVVEVDGPTHRARNAPVASGASVARNVLSELAGRPLHVVESERGRRAEAVEAAVDALRERARELGLVQ